MIRKAYVEMFQALCMNRSRSRRMLCHLILLWEGLQLDVCNFSTPGHGI